MGTSSICNDWTAGSWTEKSPNKLLITIIVLSFHKAVKATTSYLASYAHMLHVQMLSAHNRASIHLMILTNEQLNAHGHWPGTLR